MVKKEAGLKVRLPFRLPVADRVRYQVRLKTPRAVAFLYSAINMS